MPLDAKIFINPDDSISGTMPVKLYLYQGEDDLPGSDENYMTIEFNLDVSASSEGLTFMFLAGEEIVAKFINGSTIISRTVENLDTDVITISDGLLTQPATLNLKILKLLSTVIISLISFKNLGFP